MREEFKPHSTLYKENQILSCGEKSKKFQLKTQEARFSLVKIDGGVEQDNANTKCDFLAIKTTDDDIWIYIELKGKNIGDAYKQVMATYERYQQANALKYIAIVSSRCPSQDTSIQNLKNKAKKKGFKDIFSKNCILKLAYNKNDFKNPVKQIN